MTFDISAYMNSELRAHQAAFDNIQVALQADLANLVEVCARSVEMGGKPSFFTGEYQKYAWSRIFDPKLGGFELIALYSDALVKMNLNPMMFSELELFQVFYNY